MPQGIIYDSQRNTNHGVARIILRVKDSLLNQVAKGFVGGVLSYFIVSAILIYGPVVRNQITSDFATTNTFVTDEYLNTEAEGLVQLQEEVANLNLNLDFSLYIPKINARANIVANVDTANEEEYRKALKEGVAHAKGTFFPGQEKTVYLFAHSTDSPLNFLTYNVVFYQLAQLESGDTIMVYFANKKYNYTVSDKKVVSADEVSWLVRDFGGEKLILQTCTPPGTTLKRLLVFADPV